MPLWAKLLAAVMFIAVMAVASTIVHAVVPGLADWMWDHIGAGGSWAILILLLGACAAYGIHGHRKAGRSPNGR